MLTGRFAPASLAACYFEEQKLGSDTNFSAVHRTAPSGRAVGSANLGSDPKFSQAQQANSTKTGNPQKTTPEGASVWTELASLQGPPALFWEHFLRAMGDQLGARRVLLLVCALGQPWQALAQWPAQAHELPGDADGVLQLLQRTQPDLPLVENLSQGGRVICMRLPDAPVPAQQVVAVVAWHANFETTDASLMAWAQAVAAVPALYARHSAAPPVSVLKSQIENDKTLLAEPHAERLYQILRLSIELSQQDRFLQMAYEFCNTLAVRFDLDQVSLGWIYPPYVRLTAISHIEKFDPQSTITRALEGAMEEAADQSGELVYPLPADSRQVHRANESYALMQGVAAVACVPLRDGARVKGVLCLEKRQGRWTEDELWELRLITQIAVRPLTNLQQSDRWWGARAKTAMQQVLAKGLKPRHSAWKLFGFLTLVGLLLLTFLPWAFRVDAGLILRSKDLLFMPAPFDGYLQQVHVDVGDKVQAGQVLVQLDIRDLLLEQSMAEADVMRYRGEAEKAQAVRQFAEMQINRARQNQSASRLALVRHQLAQATLTAPHAGVVVEGELKKNLGAPVRKGDLLLKLAHTEDTYLELEIAQVDVHEVHPGTRGEFALVGRPDQRFEIELERIDPAPTLREGRSVYLARAKVLTAIPAWWRPGMGGSAKLDAGDRPLIWVLTHRTVRFLREFFWL